MKILQTWPVKLPTTPRFNVSDLFDGTKLQLVDSDSETVYIIDCFTPEKRDETFFWNDTQWSAFLFEQKEA